MQLAYCICAFCEDNSNLGTCPDPFSSLRKGSGSETTLSIDPLHLRHVIRGISVYYLEAAILEYRNTLASYAVSIENVPCITAKRLCSLRISCSIEHMLEALFVYDCVCRDCH